MDPALRFLSALAIERNVAASTQNRALSALLFLYRDVLAPELPWLGHGPGSSPPPARDRAILVQRTGGSRGSLPGR